jgi:hypothetical protein
MMHKFLLAEEKAFFVPPCTACSVCVLERKMGIT